MSDFQNRRIMAANIQKYMAICGYTRLDLAKLLGISYSTLRDWVTAKTYPRINKIDAMAQIFGCEKKDLIEQPGVNTLEALPADDIRVLEQYHKLSEENRDLIVQLITRLAFCEPK